MTTTLVTVSNALFAPSRARLVASARAHGITSICDHDFDDLKAKEPFFEHHREVFAHARGLGFWLWKPFIVQTTLAGLADGDVLIYMDSGTEIIGNLAPLADLCKSSGSMVLFGNGVDTNARWTRRDCFVEMGCDTPEYWYGPHCDASIVLACKSAASTAFVDEWLNFCCNPAVLTDTASASGLPNIADFQDHRHDQSVLSILAQKHRLALHRIPSQFGNHYKMYPQRVSGEFNCKSQWDQTQTAFYAALPYHNSPYGQLVNHHRTRLKVQEPEPVKASLPRQVLQRLERYITGHGDLQ